MLNKPYQSKAGREIRLVEIDQQIGRDRDDDATATLMKNSQCQE